MEIGMESIFKQQNEAKREYPNECRKKEIDV
jgi:hypothetical protein